ncbi:hypothetical protein ACFSQJ_19485 [Croceitalea marina]|uniref:Lipoprotein n=1 Tax=Croceitalea marina TaxID=1775166 RepID=A0ABW5N1Z8_9FLAO
MKNFKVILSLAIFFIGVSCNEVRDNFDWGLVQEGVYINKFFGMEWEIPKDWHYDDNFAEQWTKTNKPDFTSFAQRVYKIKERMAIPHGEVKNSYLFMLNKKDIALGQKDNPTIFLFAENLNAVEGNVINTLEDYIDQTIKESNANSTVTLDSDEYQKERVGGTTFYKLTGVRLDNKTKYKEHYYLTLMNGFGLTMLLRAEDNKGIAELEAAIEQISL